MNFSHNATSAAFVVTPRDAFLDLDSLCLLFILSRNLFGSVHVAKVPSDLFRARCTFPLYTTTGSGLLE